MARVKEMTVDELEQLVEQKVLELLGDPDSGLRLRPEFKKKLEKRFKRTSKRVPHQEAMKRFKTRLAGRAFPPPNP